MVIAVSAETALHRGSLPVAIDGLIVVSRSPQRPPFIEAHSYGHGPETGPIAVSAETALHRGWVIRLVDPGGLHIAVSAETALHRGLDALAADAQQLLIAVSAETALHRGARP